MKSVLTKFVPSGKFYKYFTYLSLVMVLIILICGVWYRQTYIMSPDNSSSNLILVDCWDTNEDMLNDSIKFKEFVDTMRDIDVTIYHHPNSGTQAKFLVHEDDKFIRSGLVGFIQLMFIRGKCFYAGYSSDMCVLNRPAGIINAYRLWKKIYFVSDFSAASAGEVMHESIKKYIKLNYGEVITMSQALTLLEE